MHIGSSISHYKIVEKLGEGGMGVVYKAEDTKLKREVALKFLAPHLLSDAEAKERFLREAQAAAALHHPNVCPVHEIDDVDDKTFIAMAFLEGESLEDRIAEGPLSLKDALDISRQVADGLQAAHAKGVFHRDIKPANIIVSPEGRATIMDFGLARLTEASRLTKVDTAMGTVAYMSPEQAQGMEVDGRTDIWALGCVLYEMVSGQRPFRGQYDQALLYEIVHEEPAALTGLRTGVPVELELLVAQCLEKDREDRYGAAAELARDLRKLFEKFKSGRSTILRTAQMTGAVRAEMTGPPTLNPTATIPPDAVLMKRRRSWALQALAALSTLAFVWLAAIHFTELPPERLTRRFSFDSRPVVAIGAHTALSPDGMHIAYAIPGELELLRVQDLDQDEPRALPGTEGARRPFWSPDSDFIGYHVFVGNKDELRKISVDGGASEFICVLPGFAFFGASWSPDGESIVVSSGSPTTAPLYEVSSQGGSPEVVLTAGDVDDSTVSAAFPQFLPGADHQALLFALRLGPDSEEMYAKDLDTGETVALGPGARPIFAAATGHLIYQPGLNIDELWARPFSPETLAFTGPAFPVRQNAHSSSVSDDGTLMYLDGAASSGTQTLAWLSRTGELQATVGQPQPNIGQLALSPDGQRVAVMSTESGNPDIWIHDLTRSTKTRLTFDNLNETTPAWSPSGREIVYLLRVSDLSDRILRRAADGTGEPSVVVDSEVHVPRPDWSRDGRYLVYDQFDQSSEEGLQKRNDIYYVELGAEGQAGEPVMFVGSLADEQAAKLSPDGRYLAYESNESGRYEIYIQSFPTGGGKWQASVNGGTAVRWRSDGRELYYVEGDALMAVSVSAGPSLELGLPKQLFPSSGLATGPSARYDVSDDGQRFLVVVALEDEQETTDPKIRIVQNWYEQFRDRQQ